MTTESDRLVEDYLDRLEAELRGVPRSHRKEIVEDVAGHIQEGRASLPHDGEAAVRNLLERLGDPADIAAEARNRAEVPEEPRRRGRAMEVIALVLILIGGMVVPVLGWVAGVVLLWVSDAWATRDKLLGTLVVPGGLALPAFIAAGLIGPEETCSELSNSASTVTDHCAGGTSALWVALFAFLILGPIVTVAYLARRLKHGRAAA